MIMRYINPHTHSCTHTTPHWLSAMLLLPTFGHGVGVYLASFPDVC